MKHRSHLTTNSATATGKSRTTNDSAKNQVFEKNASINLVGKSMTIQMKVSKELLSQESDVFKHLFEGDNDELIEITEEYTFDLAKLLESLHEAGPVSYPHRWKDTEARLVCKYLLHKRSQQWAQFAHDQLAAIAGLNIQVAIDNSGHKVYKRKRSEYEETGVSDPFTLSQNDQNWELRLEGASIGYTSVSIHETEKRKFETFPLVAVIMTSKYLVNSYNRLHIHPAVHSRSISGFTCSIQYDSKISTGLSSQEKVQKDASDSETFWTIVESVFTHDGLKLKDGILCNQQDLMHILLARKFKHLWIIDKIAKYLSPAQIAQLYYSAAASTPAY